MKPSRKKPPQKKSKVIRAWVLVYDERVECCLNGHPLIWFNRKDADGYRNCLELYEHKICCVEIRVVSK